MSKPYWSGPGRGGASRLADDRPAGSNPGHSGSDPGYDSYGAYRGYDRTDDVDAPTDVHEQYADSVDYDDYDDYPSDTRWRWVAGLAAIVLLVALVAIAVATRGGDTSTSATTPTGAPDQDAITATTPRTVIATVPPTASPTEAPALPPETIVSVTPTPSAEALPPEPAPAPTEATPPGQTITYTVTGSRQLFDLVSIIYTDEQGFPRTDVNVALPWTKTVVLNPGVETRSVTATSLTGQLNCSVTDGSGATIAAQANNAAIATCTP